MAGDEHFSNRPDWGQLDCLLDRTMIPELKLLLMSAQFFLIFPLLIIHSLTLPAFYDEVRLFDYPNRLY